MLANSSFKFENSLICSYPHLKSFKLNGTFKAIEDLHIEGLSNNYENHSMTRVQDSLYLMNALNNDTGKYESNDIDIDSLNAKRLDLDINDVSSCFVENDYMLVARVYGSMKILRGLQEIGQIEFNGKAEN